MTLARLRSRASLARSLRSRDWLCHSGGLVRHCTLACTLANLCSQALVVPRSLSFSCSLIHCLSFASSRLLFASFSVPSPSPVFPSSRSPRSPTSFHSCCPHPLSVLPHAGPPCAVVSALSKSPPQPLTLWKDVNSFRTLCLGSKVLESW